jgi:hypothetical protein
MAIVREAARWLGVWALAACSGGASHWDGRRGDYGRGDYGYDVAKSNAEAHSYRSRAPLYYAQPGDLNDPWGSYIREAADRFQIPEGWVRAVMQQESGGKLYGADGSLITSSAGAMGLMQVMPQTFDVLQQRYRLGSDPYEPRTNILAGTAYIREMYDRYGAPNFLAAYNAGPDRLDSYLNDGSPLPDETVGYMASVAPQLGSMIAPVGAYAAGGVGGGGERLDDDATMRAFSGGGLVTFSVPTGVMTVRPATSRQAPGEWSIQVGAFTDPARSSAAIDAARARVANLLLASQPAITPVQSGGLYRARLRGLSATAAAAACATLNGYGLDCAVVPPGP